MVGLGEAVIAITAIVLGVGLVGLIIIKVFGTLKHWIDSKHGNKVTNEVIDRINELERFSQHAEKRIQNLETIFVDNDMNLPSPDQSTASANDSRILKNNLRNHDV